MRTSRLGLVVLLFLPSVLALGSSPLNGQQFAFGHLLGNASEAVQYEPSGQLSTLSETNFTALKHPAFPRHQVRIKKTKFCDTTVKYSLPQLVCACARFAHPNAFARSYTGYVDIGARHLFFYFFESRRDPHKDDVILWTNGGPGCSSALGLFMELGPCRIVDANNTKFHPESWNSNANIFFIDQPIGVGFSYADFGEHVGTSEEAAEDITAFIHIFFEHFAQFKGRPFHMAGESYAGRYLPVYAAHLYDYDRRLKEGGWLTPVNLSSVMIGNGMPDYVLMMPTYYEMACAGATVPPGHPVLSITECVRMKQAIPTCAKLLQDGCVDTFDKLHCQTAVAFCESEMMGPVLSSGVNPYDLSSPCEGGLDDALCYPLSKYIPAYLNKTETRKELGAEYDIDIFNTMCSDEVMTDFLDSMDRYKPTHHYVSNLLDRGIRVLMYAGGTDFFANHIGTEKWALDLDWSGQQKFKKRGSRDWHIHGKKAGKTRSYNGLTFASIVGAGHMAPYDKPFESLALARRWMAGEPL